MDKLYILNKEINEIIILKSKFISVLLPIKNIDEVEIFLEEYKNEFPKATHYIYAYIFDNKEKYFDDGEPSGTAGKPTLELLKKYNMNNVLLITIRYFGGIKLGASRLLRTYVESAKQVLEKSKKVKFCSKFVYKCSVILEKKHLFEEICNSNKIIINKKMYNIDAIDYEILSLDNIESIFNGLDFIKYEFIEERKEPIYE